MSFICNTLHLKSIYFAYIHFIIFFGTRLMPQRAVFTADDGCCYVILYSENYSCDNSQAVFIAVCGITLSLYFKNKPEFNIQN